MKINKPESLYIHIPFCKHICKYCDFTKLFYNEKFSSSYLEALFREIDSHKIDKVKTIYIGGGTPTALSDKEFEKLLSKVYPLLCKGGEFSVEANVENLTDEKLRLMNKYGVNRISIGIESSSNETLKEIGRYHSFEDAIKVVNLVKKYNFSSINIDFIYGFPNQTIRDINKDLENILKLDVDHISIYSLIVSKGTIFYNNNVAEQNEDDSRDFYVHIVETLRKNGYKRYEVSNFARNNKYSLHNINYWKDKTYYGVGLGASGYIGNVRYTNTKNLTNYINGNYVGESEIVNQKTDYEFYLLCNLRMEDGFLINDFVDKFGKNKYKELVQKMNPYIENGLIKLDQKSIHFSDEGMIIMDSILVNLF